MRLNSRFLSGFLLSVILAAGMNCRAMADTAEVNAAESAFTEQSEQSDAGGSTNEDLPEAGGSTNEDLSGTGENAPDENTEKDGDEAENIESDTEENAVSGPEKNAEDDSEEDAENASEEDAENASEEETRNAVPAETQSIMMASAGGAVSISSGTDDSSGSTTYTTSMTSSATTASTAGQGISIDGVKVEDGQEAADGSWRYLGPYGRLVMIDHDGSGESFAVAEGGVTILAAGINKIGKLTCSGNTVVLGTGIMLVDEVEMGDNSSLSLQTNTDIYKDGTGSVGFFIKTGEKEYTLANDSSMPVILDEDYTIEGVRLIVPGQSKVLFQSVGAELDPDTGEATYYFGSPYDEGAYIPAPNHAVAESTSSLTVGDGAVLQVESGAEISMNTLGSRRDDEVWRPTLQTSGTGVISMDGTVTGGGVVNVTGAAGTLQGSGKISAEKINAATSVLTGNDVTLSGTNIHVTGGGNIANLHVADSYVTLFDAVTINNFKNEGITYVITRNSTVFENMDVSGAVNLCTSKDYGEYGDMTGKITGKISGEGVICFNSGIYQIAESAVREGASIAAHGGALVYDYSTSAVTDFSGVPLHARPDNIGDIAEGDEIPMSVAIVNETTYSDSDRYMQTVYTNKVLDPADFQMAAPVFTSGGDISLTALKEYANMLIQEATDASGQEIGWANVVVELVKKSDAGLLSTSFNISYLDGVEGTVSSSDVELIRLILLKKYQNTNAGGTATTTNTSYTGTGVLGGSGAGSVKGGQSSVLFRGNSNQQPDPGPDPQPQPDPQPDPQPNPTPSPAPVPTPDSNSNSGSSGNTGNVGSSGNSSGTRSNTAQINVIITKDRDYTKDKDYYKDKEFYLVRAYRGAREITEIGQSILVELKNWKLPEGWDKGFIFAVFRDADKDGKEFLTAFQAIWDSVKNTLSFESDRTGRFALVCMPFDFELFTKDFYAALSELDVIKELALRQDVK